jgi:hypothetical protein
LLLALIEGRRDERAVDLLLPEDDGALATLTTCTLAPDNQALAQFRRSWSITDD